MNNNNTIIFGFYENVTNSFYKTEEFKSKKFKINSKSKELEIKYFSNKSRHSKILIYNLLDNAPFLIKASNNTIIDNYPENEDYGEDIILHFNRHISLPCVSFTYL